ALTIAFFFQAEDGIRYFHVTGVQTCALPIYPERSLIPEAQLVTEDPVKFVLQLKQTEGKTIWLLGGGEIISLLHNAGLIDEYIRSEEHTSELQSRENLVCRLLLEKKKKLKD